MLVEGVETVEMLEVFKKLKCDFIQGYYFSKPVCKDDFVKFIMDSQESKSDVNAG